MIWFSRDDSELPGDSCPSVEGRMRAQFIALSMVALMANACASSPAKPDGGQSSAGASDGEADSARADRAPQAAAGMTGADAAYQRDTAIDGALSSEAGVSDGGGGGSGGADSSPDLGGDGATGSPDGGGDSGGAHTSTSNFRQISAAANHTCGIDSHGAIRCWGEPLAPPPPGNFTHLSTGNGFTCGIEGPGPLPQLEGSISCTGNSTLEQTKPKGPFGRLTVGNAHACAQRGDGSVVCWGANQYGQAASPLGVYMQVSAGGDRTCVLGLDDVAVCWGAGIPMPKKAGHTFFRISTGSLRTCGAWDNVSAISCWDPATGADVDTEPGKLTEPGAFDVDTSLSHICALQGGVVCWGTDALGQSVAPPGRFLEVVSGTAHACARRQDDERVVCWGDNTYGQASPP